MVLSRLMLTLPGLAPRGFPTCLASVYETGTLPAFRALECHAAMAAVCFMMEGSGLSPSGCRRMTWLPGSPRT